MSGRGKSRTSLALIDAAYRIYEQIHPASIRAGCYQLFNLKLIASMAKTETNRVSRLLRDARDAGDLPWEWIVDESRHVERAPQWRGLDSYAHAVQDSYRKDYWLQQPVQVLVASEKGTVRGTIAPILDKYGVPFRALHGYTSTTSVHDIALETRDGVAATIILYVGDHDPSGRHMSEVDLPRRLEKYGAWVDLRRIALTDNDVRDGSLPSFDVDTKEKDPRYQWFLRQHGSRCVELDALSPLVLRERLDTAIYDVIDQEAWERCALTERLERQSINDLLAGWRGAA